LRAGCGRKATARVLSINTTLPPFSRPRARGILSGRPRAGSRRKSYSRCCHSRALKPSSVSIRPRGKPGRLRGQQWRAVIAPRRASCAAGCCAAGLGCHCPVAVFLGLKFHWETNILTVTRSVANRVRRIAHRSLILTAWRKAQPTTVPTLPVRRAEMSRRRHSIIGGNACDTAAKRSKVAGGGGGRRGVAWRWRPSRCGLWPASSSIHRTISTPAGLWQFPAQTRRGGGHINCGCW